MSIIKEFYTPVKKPDGTLKSAWIDLRITVPLMGIILLICSAFAPFLLPYGVAALLAFLNAFIVFLWKRR